jgi:hypothetical protein
MREWKKQRNLRRTSTPSSTQPAPLKYPQAECQIFIPDETCPEDQENSSPPPEK